MEPDLIDRYVIALRQSLRWRADLPDLLAEVEDHHGGAGPAVVAAQAHPALTTRGPLVDLHVTTDATGNPTHTDPTDGARASVTAAEGAHGTTVVLNVHGLHRKPATNVLGAHVHQGPCVAGDGAAALPHFYQGPGPVSAQTEVWLDLTVNPAGHATAVARVPFHVLPGKAASIVIHALPTNPAGVPATDGVHRGPLLTGE